MVYGNDSMLSVVVHTPGTRRIRLHKKGIVTELISGKKISEEPVDSFDFDFTEDQTAVFAVE